MSHPFDTEMATLSAALKVIGDLDQHLIDRLDVRRAKLEEDLDVLIDALESSEARDWSEERDREEAAEHRANDRPEG